MHSTALTTKRNALSKTIMYIHPIVFRKRKHRNYSAHTYQCVQSILIKRPKFQGGSKVDLKTCDLVHIYESVQMLFFSLTAGYFFILLLSSAYLFQN